jgi:hypothetical protein
MAYNTVSAQDNFKLSLKAYSLEPNYKVEQVHILTIENTTQSNLTLDISVENVPCVKARTSKQSNLEHLFLNENATRSLNNNVVLTPNQVFDFSIKIIKPKNIKLGSTNCSKVVAKTSGNNTSEQYVIIESYIPDPTTDN